MIVEQFVSFDTARMLKEAGFEEMVNSCFMYDDKADEYEYEFVNGYAIVKKALRDNYNGYENTISRPTQALAARWLREVHKLHVWCETTPYGDWFCCISKIKPYEEYAVVSEAEYSSFEQAFETGLREAVKLIKKQ